MLRASLFGLFTTFAGTEHVAHINELLARQAEHEALMNAKQTELEERIAELQRIVSVPVRKLMPFDGDEELGRALSTVDLAALNTKVTELATCLDHLWLIICAAMVMFMQAGFSMLEAGCCRSKNATMILTKNILDALFGTVVWYLFGYGFAYGIPEKTPNQFVGVQNFAGTGFYVTDDAGGMIATNHFKDWFFQWTFCATAATIVSGAVAERIRFEGYCIYAVVMTGLIYPVIVWWTWSGHGFLTKIGYNDFAGSGVVHFTGGISALVGAIILGAREHRWDSKNAHRFDPHNMSLVVLGTFILWFGWYGFNCGSTLAFSDAATATQAALCAMNTTIAASVGGLTVFSVRLLLSHVREGHFMFDLAGTCNGILVGLVAICAGVGDVEPHMAILIGFAGGLAHEAGSMTLKKFKVDDPCDAFAVHGCGGIVGVLLRPLLDKTGPNMEMWGAHWLALVCIGAWSGGLSAIILGILKVGGILRVDHKEELHGTDEHCQQHMYHMDDAEDAEEIAKEQQLPQLLVEDEKQNGNTTKTAPITETANAL